VGETSLLLWLGFAAFIVAMLALDLGVFSRRAHEVSFREAAIWSGVWIGLALLFNLGLYLWRGQEVALQFFTGYLIEKTLSVDNIFVFVLIFAALAVPSNLQRRLLSLGVIGALVMRAILIFAGAALIERFHWIVYLFGVFLIVTGVRFFFQHEQEAEPEKNPIVRLARRFFPVTPSYEGERFVLRRDGRRFITPLLLALLAVESADLIFALDSIPAIFAITQDPFIVFTSNAFAILGLRALYFLLAGSITRLRYLKYGLAAALVFVGLKMTFSDMLHLPIAFSLGIIVVILGAAVIFSLAHTPTGPTTGPHGARDSAEVETPMERPTQPSLPHEDQR
jgi:tellurite resistance protein TerC